MIARSVRSQRRVEIGLGEPRRGACEPRLHDQLFQILESDPVQADEDRRVAVAALAERKLKR
jgi:hypothetical protein